MTALDTDLGAGALRLLGRWGGPDRLGVDTSIGVSLAVMSARRPGPC